MRLDVQESNVPCEICGKLVKNKYTLKQHVKLVHEKKKGMISYKAQIWSCDLTSVAENPWTVWARDSVSQSV